MIQTYTNQNLNTSFQWKLVFHQPGKAKSAQPKPLGCWLPWETKRQVKTVDWWIFPWFPLFSANEIQIHGLRTSSHISPVNFLFFCISTCSCVTKASSFVLGRRNFDSFQKSSGWEFTRGSAMLWNQRYQHPIFVIVLKGAEFYYFSLELMWGHVTMHVHSPHHLLQMAKEVPVEKVGQ